MFCAVAINCVLRCVCIYICKIVDYICLTCDEATLSRRAVVYFQVSQFLKYANCFSNTRADYERLK